MTRRKPPDRDLIRASSLQPGSREQVSLVMDRMRQNTCLECGRARPGGGNFCTACLAGYPRETEVAGPYGGWRYCVRQKGPAIPGLALFEALRVGVYEYDGRVQPIAICETFEEAQNAALKALERSKRAVEAYWGWR
jgi:hypothetical protein